MDESLEFGLSVLEPFFRENFWEVVAHFFHNRVRVSNPNDLINFYRATTYYVADAEAEIHRKVSEIIQQVGFFEYEKNGYLIIGAKRFEN